MINEEVHGRKVRRWFVYSITTVVVIGAVVGLLHGLRPLILPFILGTILAYLLKPVAKSFQSTHWSKYLRLGLFFALAAVSFTWISRTITESWPSDKEKLVLKVRLQYRFNDRYVNWMGLKDNPKGNIIYQNFGQELDPIKLHLSDYFRLDEAESNLFLQYCNTDLLADKIPDKYYEYYIENLKVYKVDIAKIKAEAAETKHSDASATIGAEKSASLLTIIMHTASNWIIFPVVFMFILLDKGEILQFFMRLVPNRYFELTYSVVENVDESLG